MVGMMYDSDGRKDGRVSEVEGIIISDSTEEDRIKEKRRIAKGMRVQGK